MKTIKNKFILMYSIYFCIKKPLQKHKNFYRGIKKRNQIRILVNPYCLK